MKNSKATLNFDHLKRPLKYCNRSWFTNFTLANNNLPTNTLCSLEVMSSNKGGWLNIYWWIWWKIFLTMKIFRSLWNFATTVWILFLTSWNGLYFLIKYKELSWLQVKIPYDGVNSWFHESWLQVMWALLGLASGVLSSSHSGGFWCGLMCKIHKSCERTDNSSWQF